MDHFQGVVTDYLRANRATFVNTECCIQLYPGANPDTSGPHWYCDAIAINLQASKAYLCEVTYSKSLAALAKRLSRWREHWPQLREALRRDCGIPLDWTVQPWVFIPGELEHVLLRLVPRPQEPDDLQAQMPALKVTHLESVVPWKYPSWNRDHHDG